MSSEEGEVPVTNVQDEVAELKTQMAKVLEMLSALAPGSVGQSGGPSQLFLPPSSGAAPRPQPTRMNDGNPLLGPVNPLFDLPQSFPHLTPNETFTFTAAANPPPQPMTIPNPQPIFSQNPQPILTPSPTAPTLFNHPMPSAGTGQPHVRQATPIIIPSPSGPQMPNPEAFHHDDGSSHLINDSEAPPSRQMYRLLEERLKMVEKSGDSILKDLSDFYLVTDFVLPSDFKAPTFLLFNGNSCPNEHLSMYLRRMASYSRNDKLLIHCFQESLAGAATKWYNGLERSQISCFKDLAEAFIRQYQCNTKSAPTRLRLQTMSMKKDEAFRDYAQRWRMIATQVEPPLSESEMISTFVRTLQEPYYKSMLGVVALTYSDMLIIGERIEEGIQMGKVDPPGAPSVKKPFGRKRDADVQAVDFSRASPLALPAPTFANPTPVATYNNRTQTKPANAVPLALPSPVQPKPHASEKKKSDRVFTPLPMALSALLPGLIENRLVELLPAKEVKPPYSKFHDPNARCAFHSGMVGHTTDRCISLRHKVQDLIDQKWLTLDTEATATSSNPLPQHGEPKVNAISSDFEESEIAMFGEDGGAQTGPFVTPAVGPSKNWEVQELPASAYAVQK